ncbi:MAG: c-type cytochrome [Kofleriaceae bacterium]
MNILRAALIILTACGGGRPASVSPPAEPIATAAPESPQSTETSPTSDLLAQAALTEQYELGKRIYVDKTCASCHGDHGEGNPKNPPVIGSSALPEAAPAAAKVRKGIVFRTAGDVLAFVRTKMPLKEPGTLSDEEAAAVTAWMLSETKVPLTVTLDAANAGAISLR